MKRRILSMLIVLILCVILLPAGAKATQINGDDVYYKYTPEMVEKTYRYLDEMYIQKYPEMGLRWLYGTEQDKLVLQKLADIITEGCTTDRQKIDAIVGWINRNISYTLNAVPYAIDTFYERETSCLGYAHMLMTLARLEGIPAVWGDGVRADTTSLTIAQGKTMSMEGHAWCFVYLEGEWLMYDILWEGTKPVTDREYIAKNYVFDTVEMITPAFDADDLPPMLNTNSFVYLDGRVIQYTNGQPSYFGGSGIWLNGHDYSGAILNTDEPQYNSYQYLDDRDKINGMVKGELLHGGWLGWSEDAIQGYAYENGIWASSSVMSRNGRMLWLYSQSVFDIHVPEDSYRIIYGVFRVRKGYSGKVLIPVGEKTVNNGMPVFYEWSSENPDVATADQDGVITNYKEGSAGFRINYYYMDGDRKAEIASRFFSVYFGNIERVENYSDNNHVCSFERVVNEPTCTTPGSSVLRCSCGKESGEENVVAPLGHNYGEWKIIQQPTNHEPGLKERICQRCSFRHEEVIPVTGQGEETNPTEIPTEGTFPTTDTEESLPSEMTEDSMIISDDYLNPEVNGMDTVFMTPDGLILSAPIELVGGYEGVELVVKSGDEDLSQQAKEMISMFVEEVEAAVSYDISMISPDGEMVQPIDVVIISIPMPEGWSKERTKVYFVNVEDNYVEDVQYCVSDDGAYVRFATDYFSCYTLVQTVPEQVQEPDQNDEPVVNEFDPTGVIIVAAVVMLAAAVTVVIFLKKRKK